MTQSPFKRFLNVEDDSDAMALLGLPPTQLDPVRIDASLRDRLAKTYQHPEAESDDAEMVRKALRRAADQLRRLSAQTRRSIAMEHAPVAPTANGKPGLALTDFDRMVLAVLVANGGWNPRSREQLVALAGTHGVSVQGLLRVVEGLGDYARQGGPRLGMHEITSGQRLMPSPAATAGLPGVPVASALLDRLTENLATELRRDDPWPTIKLGVIFGVVAIAVSIVGLRLLFFSGDAKDDQAASKTQTAATAPATAPSFFGIDRTKPVQPKAAAAPGTRLVRFPRPPTFLGNGLPMDAVNAADRYPAIAAALTELSQKLGGSGEPQPSLLHDWEQAVQSLGDGWTLADASSRAAADKALAETLRAAADTPSVSDRLISALTPASVVADPGGIWRGAWNAGTLGRLGASTSMPPVVVEQARAILDVGAKIKVAGTSTFESVAREWLDARMPQLVLDVEFDAHAWDKWELWLAAQRSLGRDDSHDRSIMAAMTALVRTSTDLSRPGPSSDLLGRLLATALDRPGETVRKSVIAMFEDPKVETRDLWVLTSLMAMSDASSWFPESDVVPEDADQMHRWRLRDEIAKAWPTVAVASAATQPSGLTVDPYVGARWLALMDRMMQIGVAKNDEAAMGQLVDANRLVLAAQYLAAQNPAQALVVMDEVQDSLPTPVSTISSPLPKSSPPPATAPPQGGSQPPAHPPAAPPSGPPPDSKPTPANPGDERRPPRPIAPPGLDNKPTLTRPRGGDPRPPQGAPAHPTVPGQSIGRDGDWAAAYQALRKTEDKLDSLRALRAIAGTDLGPIDSEVFVREVYRGSPGEVRSVAQAVAAQQFVSGPNIAMEMLDQFADAQPADGLSTCIEGLAGRVLPSSRSAEWAAEARRALVSHVLALTPDADGGIDEMAEALVDAYGKRVALMRHESTPPSQPRTPAEAAALELQAWVDRASILMSSSPWPDSLAGLQRRHATRLRLAQGPIQDLIARQLGILDLLSYVAVAERPDMREQAAGVLRQSFDRRLTAPGAVQQAAEIERATVQMWRLRLNIAPAPPESPATEPSKS